MEALFEFVSSAEGGLDFATIPQRFEAQGFTAEDKVQLPLHEDGSDFYDVVQEYVQSYLGAYYNYTTNECKTDDGVQAWVARANSILPRNDLPVGEALTCEGLEDILTTFVYTVTANHAHVGQISSEIADPCHSPWAWREGELCGTPRTAFTTRFIMEATSLAQPKLLDDYTHLLPAEDDKQRWRDFQTNLAAFQSRVDGRNANRARLFRSFDLRVVEISIGI
eukprot:TRINITY_DN8158_c0_g2_i1.p1 TRINITY_DN8158_c0_g2~~TRINITY_DN8158_c0_g2_i1.p1  ORF type:complete len:249 (+),score=105.24 TRINITY_DN8158_c0_g2_i1:79-747(+)